jgi:hypothetical protein
VSAINPHYDRLSEAVSRAFTLSLQEGTPPADTEPELRAASVERRSALAEELGEREERIRILRPDWQR